MGGNVVAQELEVAVIYCRQVNVGQLVYSWFQI